jgi:hypothetical protein
VAPAENATGVSPTANVTAVFSEAMNPSTVDAFTFALEKAGTTTQISASVAYDPATGKAILKPSTNLKRGTTYVARVSTGAKDVAGNALDQNPNLSSNQSKVWRSKVRGR